MPGRLFRVLEDDPERLLARLWGKLLALSLSWESNVVVEGKIVILGAPLIDIRKGSKLYLGNGVILTSRNKGYHLNIQAPVKLFADRPGAEIRIDAETRIAGSCIHAQQSVVIGKRCLIAGNCQIIDSNGHDLSFTNVENRLHSAGSSAPIVIEDDVWIGTNTVVLPGVRIGKGAVIGANSVVSANIPAMAVARGNPAEVVYDNRLDYGELTASDTYDLGEDADREEIQR
ncbi:MAG TPA: acyltransferase [Terracidiphilus sp.]|jgi:acetyltransferase-like isoleucine patch superfamily enzyme